MLDFSALLLQCTPANVSLDTMHRIVSVESARRPHAIGFRLIRRSRTTVDGKPVVRKEVSRLATQPGTIAEAIEWARYLRTQGYDFDAGIAQIHSTNFARYGLTVESAFDPCKNIEAGGRILAECYARALQRFRRPAPALKAAISCYQSGDFATGIGTGYVQKVIAPQPTRAKR